MASPEPDRDIPTSSLGPAGIRRVPVASRSNNTGPPPAASAVAAAKAAAAERTAQATQNDSQGARHSRLGSSAAMWTKFNTVVEAEEASAPRGDRNKAPSPSHNRTLSDIPAEDRDSGVMQEYDTMVRQYHDFVTNRDKPEKPRIGLPGKSVRASPEPEDSVAPLSRFPDRKPLRNFSRNSSDDR